MHQEDLTRIQRIYENVQSGILISKGLLNDVPVAIKDQKFHSPADAAQALQELVSQSKLDHENVVKVYGCCMSQEGAVYTVSLAMECLDHDLFAEFSARREATHHWSEEELWCYLTTLVDVFALAQRKNICHRDIKPQNLFLDTEGKIKVGDFGSSLVEVSSRKNTNLTIQGSPYFLSPALKRGMLMSMSDPKAKFVSHNVFKSDVYSLGLTMLYMAKLDQSACLCRLQGLQDSTIREIDGLPHSPAFKYVLNCMLVEEEADRPDFLQLRDGLDQLMTCDDPTPRPSAVSTAASDTIRSSRRSLDPYPLVEQLNREVSEQALSALFLFEKDLTVKVGLEFFCLTCGVKFELNISCGCPSIVNMLFHSQECMMQYTVPPEKDVIQESELQVGNSTTAHTMEEQEVAVDSPKLTAVVPEEAEVLPSMQDVYITPPPVFEEAKEQTLPKASAQNLKVPMVEGKNKQTLTDSLQKSLHGYRTEQRCIVCNKKKSELLDSLMCKKCISQQEKTLGNIKTEECACCHKKWAKQGKISKLFHKKKNPTIKLKDCNHKFCSEDCCFKSLRAAKACPICGIRIKEDLLRLLKFKG